MIYSIFRLGISDENRDLVYEGSNDAELSLAREQLRTALCK